MFNGGDNGAMSLDLFNAVLQTILKDKLQQQHETLSQEADNELHDAMNALTAACESLDKNNGNTNHDTADELDDDDDDMKDQLDSLQKKHCREMTMCLEERASCVLWNSVAGPKPDLTVPVNNVTAQQHPHLSMLRQFHRHLLRTCGHVHEQLHLELELTKEEKAPTTRTSS